MTIWKNIKGYKGLYQISNDGRVKSLSRIVWKSDGRKLTLRERILKPNANLKGYLYVNLSKDCLCISRDIHILVAKAFVPGYRRNRQVNHKDGNKKNNRSDNLEWVTNYLNYIHAVKYKLKRRKPNGQWKPLP